MAVKSSAIAKSALLSSSLAGASRMMSASEMAKIRPFDLGGFMERNKPRRYELEKRPERRYNRIPNNYQIPSYGREGLPISYQNFNQGSQRFGAYQVSRAYSRPVTGMAYNKGCSSSNKYCSN